MNKEEIIAIRKALNMTQQQFAFMLGATVATISKWENGHVQPSRMSIKELRLIKDRNNINTDKECTNEP